MAALARRLLDIEVMTPLLVPGTHILKRADDPAVADSECLDTEVDRPKGNGMQVGMVDRLAEDTVLKVDRRTVGREQEVGHAALEREELRIKLHWEGAIA